MQQSARAIANCVYWKGVDASENYCYYCCTKMQRVIYGGYKIKRPIHNKLALTLELCALIYGLSKEQWLINSYDNLCRLIKDDARKCLGYVIE
jgi:hypothetical protein